MKLKLGLTAFKMRQNLMILLIYHVIFQYFNLKMLDGGFIQRIQPLIIQTIKDSKVYTQEERDRMAIEELGKSKKQKPEINDLKELSPMADMIHSIAHSKEGRPSLLAKFSGFITDRVLLNSLRHSISSIALMQTKQKEAAATNTQISITNPLVAAISIIFVIIGVAASGPLTHLMQQHYSNDEYRLILPDNLKDTLVKIVIVWAVYVNSINMGYTVLGSQSMSAYL